ncbi:MAG: OmpA family protein [Bacteroidetes bacterium]|nr:OmpA family protein [Bacteroidota bacterium]
MSKFFFIFFICLCFNWQFAFAQKQKLPELCPLSENAKAVKNFEKAKDAKKDFDKAKKYLENAVEEDTTFGRAYKMLAELAYTHKEFRLMKENYVKAIAHCPDAGWQAYYRTGNYFLENQKYTEANKYLKGVSEQGCTDEKILKEIDESLSRINLLTHPVPFDPRPVQGINTFNPEYLGYQSADGELFYFTRRFTEESKGLVSSREVEKFCVATKIEGSAFSEGKPMEPPFNYKALDNEGGPCLNIDNTKMYFTRVDKGNFDLYECEFANGKWSPFKNLKNINHPKQWDAQPSISPDGKTLYFATYRDSVNMTCDIYYSVKNEKGEFAEAKSLVHVNTDGNEKSPFMHPDNRTFYFSSDKLPGLGGFDIFMVKIDEKGKWAKPVNLGYPINTEGNEVGFFVSTNGHKGYFASDKLQAGKGSYDIYEFDLYDKIRPEKVLFLKGQLTDENKDFVTDAKIELKNVQTEEVVKIDVDSTTGKYSHVVLFDNDYLLTVRKKDNEFNSNFFSKDDSTNFSPQTVNVELKNIKVGASYNLNNILFKTNSSEISPQSVFMIANFAAYLIENKTLRIAINGHTDNQGSASENMKLSEARAKVVYELLIKNNIAANRLSYKGYGATQPVADNTSEAGKSKNRRTEIVIIGK